MNKIRGWELIADVKKPARAPKKVPVEPKEPPKEIHIFMCDDVGVNGTTDVHVREKDGKFEARVGIALFGSTNMSDEQFDACDNNPFHEDFHDNYADGKGDTKEEAIENMKKDMTKISESLFY